MTEWPRDSTIEVRCDVDEAAASDELGELYFIEAVSPSGETVFAEQRCIGASEPARPPQPPTVTEVWDAVAVSRPRVHVNPSGRGLTGLDTWLWSDPAETLTVALPAIDGYVVTGTVTPDEWSWETGDGRSYTTTDPGTAEHPAVTHLYETKGQYTLVHRVTWRGEFTITGFGVTLTVDDAGSRPQESSRPYQVIEVRGVLDDPR